MAFDKLGRFFGISNDEDEMYDNEEYTERRETEEDNSIPMNTINRDNILSIKSGMSTSAQSKIVLYEPRVFSDAKDVAQNLLNNKAVIINFSMIE